MNKPMTIRVPEDLQKDLTKEAEREGLTRNALVINIFRRWREERKEEGT